ncbi:MAG: hypothetical protein A2W25_13755 [candidate division Zixibacteria bacterium RBG_16_53_22]|nr:MAG: hypothetical protein A2W25_13755 [candidate division Zixibacteria bacterium RBG_16_53_22]
MTGSISTVHEYLTSGCREIPNDPDLPELKRLLDPGLIWKLLESHPQCAIGKIQSCEITYIRYKPSTNCLIAYRVIAQGPRSEKPEEIILYAKLHTVDDYELAVAKSQQARWTAIPDLPSVLRLDDEKALLYFYPNDCLIDGLRIISNPKKIQRLLYEHCRDFPQEQWRISDSKLKVSTIRYKPERRAVLRVDTRAIHKSSGEKRRLSVYMRAYADDRGSRIFGIQDELFRAMESASGPSVPRPLGYIPERRLLLMETLSGEPMLDRLLAGNHKDVTKAAIAISRLHQNDSSTLLRLMPDSILADASSTEQSLCQVAPEFSEQAGRITGHLAALRKAGISGNLGFVHGDFYYGQVIIQDDKAAIIDFDRSYFGETEADTGNFCAHLRLLGLFGLIKDHAELEDVFSETYRDCMVANEDGNLRRFYLAIGLFQLSVGPFRRLDSGWKQKTKAILDECQRVLQS